MVPSTVMLSAAKHLATDRDRPFAEFTLSGSEGLRVTPAGSSRRVNAVMLSAAKHLDVHRERPFAAAQGDTVSALFSSIVSYFQWNEKL
jgi:hypothetical protein